MMSNSTYTDLYRGAVSVNASDDGYSYNHNDDYHYDSNSEDGFANYIETTVDPAPWAVILTTATSILMISLIPLCVVIGDRIEKRRNRRQLERKQQKHQHTRRRRLFPFNRNGSTQTEQSAWSDNDDVEEPTTENATRTQRLLLLPSSEGDNDMEQSSFDRRQHEPKQQRRKQFTRSPGAGLGQADSFLEGGIVNVSSRTLEVEENDSGVIEQECILDNNLFPVSTMQVAQENELVFADEEEKEEVNEEENEIVFARSNSQDSSSRHQLKKSSSASSHDVGLAALLADVDNAGEDEWIGSPWSILDNNNNKPRTSWTTPDAAATDGWNGSDQIPLSITRSSDLQKPQQLLSLQQPQEDTDSYLPPSLTPPPSYPMSHRSQGSDLSLRSHISTLTENTDYHSVQTSHSKNTSRSRRSKKHKSRTARVDPAVAAMDGGGSVVTRMTGATASSRATTSSFYSLVGSVAAGVEEIAIEYVATKELWRPKARHVRRLGGGGQAVETLWTGNQGSGEEGGGQAAVFFTAATFDGDEDDANSPPSRPLPLTNTRNDDEEEDHGSRIVSKSSSSKKQQQYEFYKCDGDMKGILRLALPYTIHTAVYYIFAMMQLAIIGRLVGTDELSALLISDLVFSLATMFMDGAVTSLFTLCSHAEGGGKYYLAGQYVQIAVVFYQAFLIPMGVIGWFLLKDIVLWFGYTQDVADIAMAYAQVEYVSYMILVYRKTLDYLLEVTDCEVFAATFTIVQSALEFVVLFCFAKFGEPSLRDIALLGLGLDIFSTIVFVSVIVYYGWLKDYWGGMVGNFAFLNWEAVRVFLKTSLPLSFGYILATGEWEVLTVLAGFLGPAEVSAWGLLGWFWEAIEEITLAVSNATEVKVGKMLGSGQAFRARGTAHKSLFLGLIISLLYSLPIFAMKDVLPGFFTTDETLISMMTELIPLVGIGNIVLMFGSMCWTILGAQGRYAFSTTLQFIGSWGLTIPLASIFTFALRFDLQALTGAVVVGYASSGSLTASFLFRSDWEQMSRNVIKDTNCGAGSSVDYDDFDWDELPPHVQAAATLLGYNQTQWDEGVEPAVTGTGWDELEPEQREAATILGYSKEKWDDDDSSDSESEDEEISSKVIQDSMPGAGSPAVNYDDFDWDELPPHAQSAATRLGYNKTQWNKGLEPAACNKSWNKLEPEQREAATILGYSKEKWDD